MTYQTTVAASTNAPSLPPEVPAVADLRHIVFDSSAGFRVAETGDEINYHTLLLAHLDGLRQRRREKGVTAVLLTDATGRKLVLDCDVPALRGLGCRLIRQIGWFRSLETRPAPMRLYTVRRMDLQAPRFGLSLPLN